MSAHRYNLRALRRVRAQNPKTLSDTSFAGPCAKPVHWKLSAYFRSSPVFLRQHCAAWGSLWGSLNGPRPIRGASVSKSSSSHTNGKGRLKGKGLCAVETDRFKLSQPQEGRHGVAPRLGRPSFLRHVAAAFHRTSSGAHGTDVPVREISPRHVRFPR